jgi:hypothetical protein
MGASAGAAIGGIGSLFGGLIGSNASQNAAQTQAAAAQQGIDLQKSIFNTQQQNQAPYMAGGTQSLNQILKGFADGTFGPGSIPAAPQYAGAPTAEQARATPGYQFTADQGTAGILRGASAAGGAINGGTLKSLAQYNSGLADSTYNNVFNRSMQQYQAQLQGYGAQLQGQQQGFNQLFAPAQLGENAVASINNTGSVQGANIASLIGQQGNALAAGQVGSANALIGGIGGAANSAGQAITLQQLLSALKPTAPTVTPGQGPG